MLHCFLHNWHCLYVSQNSCAWVCNPGHNRFWMTDCFFGLVFLLDVLSTRGTKPWRKNLLNDWLSHTAYKCNTITPTMAYLQTWNFALTLPSLIKRSHFVMQLMHAKMQWPSAISVALWPYYALCGANDILNAANMPAQESSPLDLLRHTCKAKARNFSSLQLSDPTPQTLSTWETLKVTTGNSTDCKGRILNHQPTKWELRFSINLGQSLRHASTVMNILNPRTGLVSPQFHLKFDDILETVIGTNEIF